MSTKQRTKFHWFPKKWSFGLVVNKTEMYSVFEKNCYKTMFPRCSTFEITYLSYYLENQLLKLVTKLELFRVSEIRCANCLEP